MKLHSLPLLAALLGALTLLAADEAPPAAPATKDAPPVTAAPKADVPAPAKEPAAKPLIQLAILLDTSNSMDGLIDQAKRELWRVVNSFVTATREGQRPEFQVALYEYGKQSLPAAEGYIRLILPLTTDLDKVSEELFALKTNGGDEYCGWVIKRAAEELAWSNGRNDLKTIYICGNEPFTQGKVAYAESCKAAIAKGITVNTIFCGNQQDGINTKWQDGAALADGAYLSIDQNRVVAAIVAPQDAEIARLGGELNKTYLAYGSPKAQEARERQAAQDANAAKASPTSSVQRALTKSSGYYRNADWDLVDAVKDGKAKLEDVPEAELPPELQKLSKAERAAALAAKAKERAELQAKIQALNAEREKYVVAEQRKQAEIAAAATTALSAGPAGTAAAARPGGAIGGAAGAPAAPIAGPAPAAETLDSAMQKSLKEQAEKKGFKF